MRVYRDLAYVKQRKRRATLSAVLGVALLGSAFWLASATGQNGILIAYVPLLAGTIIFHLGMQQVGKWNRAQRNDVILDTLLKDLGERYTLVHYAKLGKRVVEHSLVYPGGVMAIVARELPGGVGYENGRWRKIGQGLTRFFGMGGAYLGNPSNDATSDTAALNTMLEGMELPQGADAVIAFLNPRVKLEVTEPDFPVTNGEGLKPFITSLPADPGLRTADRQNIVEALIEEGTFEAPEAEPTRRPVKRRVA
jgi:hypothetical protein